MRLGYHYNTIDAYVSDQVNDNYIYFRFLGGVTELVRRSRRARFVAEVLDRFDFRIEVHAGFFDLSALCHPLGCGT
jgi:hypothetical protein